MIVYNANVTIVVQQLTDAIDRLGQIARAHGGYVAGVDYKANERSAAANASIRVRAEAYQDAMREIRGGALEVRAENATTQDVTEEFDDLQTQIRTLEAVELQYEEFLKKATTLDETLRIQQKIEETRLRINRLKGRSMFLDRKSELATINVSMVEQAVPGPTPTPTAVPTPAPVWEPEKAISESWSASIRMLAKLGEVGLRIIVFFWWGIPFVVIGGLVAARWWTRTRPPAVV